MSAMAAFQDCMTTGTGKELPLLALKPVTNEDKQKVESHQESSGTMDKLNFHPEALCVLKTAPAWK